MKTLIYDIETAPLPEAELLAMLPPFDPAEVKVGNIKDPSKIAEKIAEAESSHRQNFMDRAALDPLTGRVLAIGFLPLQGASTVLGDDDEATLLREFWDKCTNQHGAHRLMVGFNTHLFDLPFLVRRSWKHRVKVPAWVRRGRYWSDNFIDLREHWQLGDRMAKGSLDAVAKHLGCGSKSGNGKDFARLWTEDRKAALAYLENDLKLTLAVAKAMGAILETVE